MNVIEALATRCERKSPEEAARKRIGKSGTILDIEDLKGSRALTTLLDFVEKQIAVR